MLLSFGELQQDPASLRDKDIVLRDWGLEMMNYILPEEARKDDLSLPLKASIALLALKKSGLNSEVDPLYQNLRNLFAEQHESGAYQTQRRNEVLDATLTRLLRTHGWGVYAAPGTAAQYTELRRDFELNALVNEIVDNGVVTDRKINYRRDGEKARLEVLNSNADALQKLLAETLELPYTRQGHESRPELTKFEVDMQPMMSNWQKREQERVKKTRDEPGMGGSLAM